MSFFPPGFKPGCLPADHLPGEVCDLASEKIEIFTDQEIREFIDAGVSLRKVAAAVNGGRFDIHHQNSRRSCAGDSACGGMRAIALAAGYKNYPRLNPWSVYGGSRGGQRGGTSGGRDNGSSLASNMRHLRDVGALPAAVFPRGNWGSDHIENAPDPNRLWAELPKGWEKIAKFFRIVEFWQAETIREALSGVVREFSGVFGWRGHSCFIDELNSEHEADYANSWGDWGDDGHGKISLRDVNFGYGFYLYRSVVAPTGWEEAAADVLGVDVSVIHERLALEAAA
jgi:hypothetical protein